MAAITGKDKVCKDICDALGLKNVRSLDLHMSVDDVVTVTVQYFPESGDLPGLQGILKEYELTEKKGGT